MPTPESPYDLFAWFYDRYWAEPFQDWQEPILESLLFADVPPHAHILDLCCGTGQLAKRLLHRGYRVTGVDSSPEMLHAARRRAPAAQFIHSDATTFAIDEPADAAVCTFDSINHLKYAVDVELALRKVHAALKPEAPFIFDINTGIAYGERWDHTACEIQPDHVFILRGDFDPQARIGTTRVTMFRQLGEWHRSDVQITQRPWELSEIIPMLEKAGFTSVRAYRPFEDLKCGGHYGIGRVYVRACKSSNAHSES